MESQRNRVSDAFRHFSHGAASVFGTHWAFSAAFLLVIAWAALGPVFDYSDVWQLTINTATTIVTFLMVFLVQTTQNRDAKALHLKLDELIRSSPARNQFADLEDADDADIDAYQREFEELRRRYREHTAAKRERARSRRPAASG